MSSDTPGAQRVVVTHLEMTDAGRVVPAPAPSGARLEVVAESRPDLSRQMYLRVGGPWHWVDRADWTEAEWTAWVDRPEHRLLLCWVDGVLHGYAELEQQQGGNVEIAYFGLLPDAGGQGLGRWWLSAVLATAWDLPGTERVWVHTCDLDSPAALPTYRGRGMVECGSEIEWRLPS